MDVNRVAEEIRANMITLTLINPEFDFPPLHRKLRNMFDYARRLKESKFKIVATDGMIRRVRTGEIDLTHLKREVAACKQRNRRSRREFVKKLEHLAKLSEPAQPQNPINAGEGEAVGAVAGEAGGAADCEAAGSAGSKAAGSAGGEAAGSAGGEAAGVAGGETAGEAAGETAGEAAGETAGEAAGGVVGEARGEAEDEIMGEVMGEGEGSSSMEPTEDQKAILLLNKKKETETSRKEAGMLMEIIFGKRITREHTELLQREHQKNKASQYGH